MSASTSALGPLTEIDLQVTGMTCASCVMRVEKALSEIPGVRNASVTLATGKATVVVDSSVAPEALAAAVRRAGYNVASRTVEL